MLSKHNSGTFRVLQFYYSNPIILLTCTARQNAGLEKGGRITCGPRNSFGSAPLKRRWASHRKLDMNTIARFKELIVDRASCIVHRSPHSCGSRNNPHPIGPRRQNVISVRFRQDVSHCVMIRAEPNRRHHTSRSSGGHSLSTLPAGPDLGN
jgi:GMP synthase-like glutamine amidotransferase